MPVFFVFRFSFKIGNRMNGRYTDHSPMTGLCNRHISEWENKIDFTTGQHQLWNRFKIMF